MRINIGPIQMRRRVSIGPLKIGIKKVYPELENLEIKPSGVEQNFKSEKYYGYNEITVNPVASDTLNVVPSEEEQQITGLFGIVNVDKIPTKYVVPQVEDNVLILSRGEVEGGALSL